MEKNILSGLLKKILRAEHGALRNLPIVTAIICWVAAVTFVKYFSTMMDVHTQNFFRYCGASVFLSILVSVAYPGCFKRYLARWRVYFFLGSMVVAFQVCWVNALYRVDPAFVSLLGKVSTPLITVMAFLFYREERKVIRKPAFLAGFAMGMAGVAGVVVGISNFKTGLMDTQLTGIVLLLISSLIWSVYANLVKHILRTENSLQAFTFTCVSATVLFFPFMILRGNPGRLLGASPGLIALVIISGIIGIAGANSCYYLSIKRIGLAKSANLALAQPFLVGVVSFLIFGEILTMVQWIFGAVLLAGCALVISVEGQNDR